MCHFPVNGIHKTITITWQSSSISHESRQSMTRPQSRRINSQIETIKYKAYQVIIYQLGTQLTHKTKNMNSDPKTKQITSIKPDYFIASNGLPSILNGDNPIKFVLSRRTNRKKCSQMQLRNLVLLQRDDNGSDVKGKSFDEKQISRSKSCSDRKIQVPRVADKKTENGESFKSLKEKEEKIVQKEAGMKLKGRPLIAQKEGR